MVLKNCSLEVCAGYKYMFVGSGAVADPKILKGGGGKRQFISSILIYRKCAQRKINTKKRLFEKKCKTTGGGRSHRPP